MPAVTGTVSTVTAVVGRPSLSRRARGPGLNLSLRWCRSLSNRSLARARSRSPRAAPPVSLEPPSAALRPKPVAASLSAPRRAPRQSRFRGRRARPVHPCRAIRVSAAWWKLPHSLWKRPQCGQLDWPQSNLARVSAPSASGSGYRAKNSGTSVLTVRDCILQRGPAR